MKDNRLITYPFAAYYHGDIEKVWIWTAECRILKFGPCNINSFGVCFCIQSMEVILQMSSSADCDLETEHEHLSTSSTSTSCQVLFLPLNCTSFLLSSKRIMIDNENTLHKNWNAAKPKWGKTHFKSVLGSNGDGSYVLGPNLKYIQLSGEYQRATYFRTEAGPPSCTLFPIYPHFWQRRGWATCQDSS